MLPAWRQCAVFGGTFVYPCAKKELARQFEIFSTQREECAREVDEDTKLRERLEYEKDCSFSGFSPPVKTRRLRETPEKLSCLYDFLLFSSHQ
jgi:hypothetical protein